MNLTRSFSLLVVLRMILASGMALADDVISIGVLPGSSISVRGTSTPLGQDPPVTTLNNVLITDDGTGGGVLSVAQSDVSFEPVDSDAFGFVVRAQIRAQSDGAGVYDRNTGSSTLIIDTDVKYTSDLPGFDNDNCIIPSTTFNLSTDNPGGSLCFGGNCTVVDNTFVVNAIPAGSCGSSFIGDYATLINQQVGLPSFTPGDNVASLVILMTPALPP